MSVAVWIDDERPVPVDFEDMLAVGYDNVAHVKTSQEAIDYLAGMGEERPLIISFDHDLGYNYEDGSSAIDGGVRDDNSRRVLDWMIEHDFWPTELITIHSMNPIGAKYLYDVAKRYAPPWIAVQRVRLDWKNG